MATISSDAEVFGCHWHNIIKLLALHYPKNACHALLTANKHLGGLLLKMYYGTLPLRRRSTSTHFESALSASIYFLSKLN